MQSQYQYSKRTEPIPSTQFGLPGRHAFPIPSTEKYTKLMQDTLRKIDLGIISKKYGKKILEECRKIVDADPNKLYKKWLKDYHNFTASLEAICKKFNIIEDY